VWLDPQKAKKTQGGGGLMKESKEIISRGVPLAHQTKQRFFVGQEKKRDQQARLEHHKKEDQTTGRTLKV